VVGTDELITKRPRLRPWMGDDADEHCRLVRGGVGTGRWSAEMFLMFHLRRLDVWPTGDFTVRAGYAAAWGIEVEASTAALEGTKSSIIVLGSGVGSMTSERSRDGLRKDNSRWQL
jgi:3-methyladenine DNA glycosylase/8-oxoguanine DNA glycosylase